MFDSMVETTCLRGLTVDARRGPSKGAFWWVRIGEKDGEAPLRRAYALADVRSLLEEYECTHIVWNDGAYRQMVEAGVAPKQRPIWLAG